MKCANQYYPINSLILHLKSINFNPNFALTYTWVKYEIFVLSYLIMHLDLKFCEKVDHDELRHFWTPGSPCMLHVENDAGCGWADCLSM